MMEAGRAKNSSLNRAFWLLSAAALSLLVIMILLVGQIVTGPRGIASLMLVLVSATFALHVVQVILIVRRMFGGHKEREIARLVRFGHAIMILVGFFYVYVVTTNIPILFSRNTPIPTYVNAVMVCLAAICYIAGYFSVIYLYRRQVRRIG